MCLFTWNASLTVVHSTPHYVFELEYEFPKDSWFEYCKVISKECVDYFMENVMPHPCIPLYNAAHIASTMKKNGS